MGSAPGVREREHPLHRAPPHVRHRRLEAAHKRADDEAEEHGGYEGAPRRQQCGDRVCDT
jgi:hypothetical protein